ncbi:MAG: MSMEG_4193 family putative phosphomutase [Herbiconiux sp.]|nr:MSMEG_4193 family putative phosphomutase [Herbiconiux sp.]
MATVILVRHGRTTANAGGLLAGRTPGVRLDELGHSQAEHTAERLAAVALVAVVSSPLERCRETAEHILNRQHGHPLTPIEPGITECDYGQWQGRTLKELSTEKLWSVVQSQPSAAAFPGGESMAAMQARSVQAVRRLDAEFDAEYGAGAVWVAVSHGDIIKSVLADALGMHLDLFQRLNVNPASVSIVRYGPHRPEVLATNTESGDLSWLRASTPAEDAAVGGGAGHEPATASGRAAPAPRS